MIRKYQLIFLLLQLSMCSILPTARSQEKHLISGEFFNISFPNFVKKIEPGTPYKFYFNPDQLDSLIINQSANAIPLLTLLDKVLAGSTFYYLLQNGNNIYILDKKIKITEKLDEGFFSGLSVSKAASLSPTETEKKKSVLITGATLENKLIEIGNPANKTASGSLKLTGYIRDQKTGESLSGAVVYTDKDDNPVQTDPYGYYSLSLNPGRYTLYVSNAGKKTARRQILVHESGKLDLDMQDDIPTLKTIIVVAERNSNTRRMQMGVEKISVRTIKQVPVLMGEPDILRVVMALPGVTTVSEASTGFNVRGGSADQNLVLYNDATIYNPSHLFGFFSAFNTESVKSVDLYKSSIPSKYGGRLASVLDISGREGNAKKWTGTAGISMLTGKFSIEGPLVKDKTTLLFGARATYSDWLIRQIKNPEYNNSTASFSDIDLHINHSFNDRDKISLTLYGSQDGFKIAGDSLYKYGNRNLVFRWRHVFTPKLSMALATGYDSYKYSVEGDEGKPESFRLRFSINQAHIKTHFSYAPNNNHYLEFGLNSILYNIQPGSYDPVGAQSLVEPQKVPDEKGLETALYLSDKYNVTKRLSIEGGLRYSMYQYIGPKDVLQYIEGLPRTTVTVIDTVSYGKGKVVQTYHGPEFRLALRYNLNDRSSIKAGYNSLRQYLHLLSNTAAVSPTDIWKLSDTYIKPQSGQQLSLGYYLDFPDKSIETSLEVYYKKLSHVLDFKSGASVLLNDHPETEVINTRGKAWGIEFMIKKNTGKLNGWLSYTFSRSMLQMDDSLAGQLINKGDYYPANYDKPHIVNLVTNYKFTHRYSASFNLAYSTGRPITLPIAIFNYAGSQRIYYSERNQYRIPDYFRIDLSFNIEGNHKLKQKVHSSWTLGVYNMTGRDNPYSIYFTEDNGQVKGYQLSIIGNVIPYVTLNLRF